jgi:ribosomal protein L37AE/L43A
MSERTTKCTCDPHCQMHGIYPPVEPSGTTGPADAGSHARCPSCGSRKQERIAGLWLCNACTHEWDDAYSAPAADAGSHETPLRTRLREMIAKYRAMAAAARNDGPIPNDEREHAGRWTMAEIIADELEAALAASASAPAVPRETEKQDECSPGSTAENGL